MLEEPANFADDTSDSEVPKDTKPSESHRQWELVIDKSNFKLYRRPSLMETHLYEYKCESIANNLLILSNFNNVG